MTFRRTPRAFPSLLVVLALVAGCSQAPPRQTEFMERLAAEGVTVRELQVEVYNFAIYFNDLVEDAADRIYARTDDPVLRDRALLWKMSAIPKMQRAAFREDPLAGLISAWSFCVQLRNWFETGPGREHFGEHQSVALGAVIEAERAAEALARGVSQAAEFENARSRVQSWALAHPIVGSQFNRLAPSDSLAGMAAADAIGGLAAAAAMNEQMRSLNDRINIAMEQMPKQIRWQSELMLSQVPELMRAERDSILAAFDPRMQRTFEFVSGERAAMAAEFLVHREAMLAAIRGEREAMLSALREERAIVLAALKSERAIVLDSLGTVLPRAMREVIADTEPVVDRSADRLLLRIAALAAIPLIAGFILAIWALLIARRAASH